MVKTLKLLFAYLAYLSHLAYHSFPSYHLVHFALYILLFLEVLGCCACTYHKLGVYYILYFFFQFLLCDCWGFGFCEKSFFGKFNSAFCDFPNINLYGIFWAFIACHVANM